MAKFVVAGRSDCPYFARAELLGDRLAKNLNKFKLHKIMIQPNKWDQWLKETCAEKGWEFHKSPIVWRELIDRGGKGVLIGGANEFQEYVKAYYDLESEMNSYDMQTVSAENKVTKNQLDEEEAAFKALSKPLQICITNAKSPISYHLLHTLTSGLVLGKNTEISIRLLVSKEEHVEAAQGMAMEAEDLANHLLRGVKVYTNAHDAFENCSVIILLDEFLKQEKETKLEWLKRNADFFSRYANIITDKALSSCKVMLCGNGPSNFNAMIMTKNAPALARQNIVAVPTVVENHAKSVIGERLSVNPAGVVSLLVWGNINGENYLDVSKCRVHNYDGAIWGPYWYSVSAVEMIHDQKWIEKELPGLVKARGAKVAAAMGRPTCLSAANAIATCLQYWCQGSPQGMLFSLGVCSEGWYGIPENLFFSFPVTMDPKGYWNVVQDIELTQQAKEALSASAKEIQKQMAVYKGEPETDDENEEEKKDEAEKEAEEKKDQPAEGQEEPSTETKADAPETVGQEAEPDVAPSETEPTADNQAADSANKDADEAAEEQTTEEPTAEPEAEPAAATEEEPAAEG